MKWRSAIGLLASVGMMVLASASLYANAPASAGRSGGEDTDLSGGMVAVVYEGADQSVVNVPFMFAAGGSVLPSGKYKVAPDRDDPELLRIVSDDGSHQALVGTLWERGTNASQHASFLFKDYSGARVLSAVALPGEGVRSIPMPARTLEKDLRTMAQIRFRTESVR